MSLNAALALEILEIASSYPDGVSIPSEAAGLDRYSELRRTFDILVQGRFLVAGKGARYLLSQRSVALIRSLEVQVEKNEARKKELRTLVFDVLGS